MHFKNYILGLIFILLFSSPIIVNAQDTAFKDNGVSFTLAEAIVRNHFDYKAILQRIKEDTSFYKAFKTLRTIGYSSFNHIEMKDKDGKMQASYP